jgi:ABC-type polysaccharide/polyol phosphate export permease
VLSQFRQLYDYREAIRNFVARDLKVRYSNSALGVVWSLFNPLLTTLVFTLVFTYFLPNPGIEQYPVFFLAGLLPWNFFSLSMIGAVNAVTGNGHLITRVYFPRAILPVSTVLANAVHFFIALAPFFALALLYRIPLGPSLLWLPVIALAQMILSLGIGLGLSALNVFFRDLQQVVEIVILPWLFLTPVFYPPEFIADPTARLWLLALNPMAGLVTHYRQVLYVGAGPDLALLGVTALEGVLALAVGALIFYRLSPAFAEEI